MPGRAPAAAAPVADAGRVALGIYLPEALLHPERIDRYARVAGREPVIVSAYIRWTEPPFVHAQLEQVWRRGAVPMITWEPWTLGNRGFLLSDIAAGRYDAYIRQAAQAAAAWGRPILLRFAQEMNGSWYPWGRGRDGNTPDLYKRAWIHLVEIFAAYGARNVEWVWTPNENSSGRYPFQQFYPGDRWVSWVGLDGYNWASRGSWDSFTTVFGASYDALLRVTSRPVIIAETGSSQTGGDKAAWVDSALRREIPAFEGIRAVVWFDAPFPHLDARIDSSAAALQAFRAGARSPAYAITRAAFLAAPRTLQQRVPAPAAPTGGYGAPSLAYRLTHKLHGKYLWYAIAAVILAGLLIITAAVFLRRRLRAGRS